MPRRSLLSRLSAGPSTSEETSPDDAAPRRGTTSTEAVRSWRRRWKPGGEPDDVKAIIGAVILIVIGAAGLSLRGRQLDLRRPDADELEAIAGPLAQIACRNLPMQMLGPDLLDGIRATRAAQDYATAGPLVIPRITAGPIHQEDQ